jgi:hypothetical protein
MAYAQLGGRGGSGGFPAIGSFAFGSVVGAASGGGGGGAATGVAVNSGGATANANGGNGGGGGAAGSTVCNTCSGGNGAPGSVSAPNYKVRVRAKEIHEYRNARACRDFFRELPSAFRTPQV